MADYYSLIARAVAVLEKNSGENRRALYERARAALLAQLRGLTPALDESDITRERLALEESIRKVEAESAREFAETTRQPPAPKVRATESHPERAVQPRQLEHAAELRRARDLDEPSPPPRRYPPPEEGRKEARRVDSVELPPLVPRPPAERDRGQCQRMPASFDRFEPRALESKATHEPMFEPHHDPYAHHEFSEPMLESSFPMDDAHAAAGDAHRASHVPALEDEAAPRTLAWRSSLSSRGLILGLALIALALAGIYVLVRQGPNLVALYRPMRTPAVETVRGPPPSSIAQRKLTERIEPNSQVSTTPEQGAQAAAAMTQKVVLYEENSTDPNGNRFVGSAIWHTETPGPGQPNELSVRADVEVPERKLNMTWSLRRNTDKSLPASHTVEIIFNLPPDFPSGGISNVPGILMKEAEQTRGVPLAGLAVKVTNGFFLIGLSNVEAEKERNLQLLKDRAWFDVPVVYSNNRRAILAMEKGTPGERVFAEAFKVWNQ